MNPFFIRQKLFFSIIVFAPFWFGCGLSNVKITQGSNITQAKEYMTFEMYEPAIKLLELEIQANPKNAEAYYQVGIAYLCVGEGGKAKASFDQAMILERKYKDTLGMAYFSAGVKLVTTHLVPLAIEVRSDT